MPEVFLSLSDGILRSGERNLVFPLLFRRSEREKRLAARVCDLKRHAITDTVEGSKYESLCFKRYFDQQVHYLNFF